MLQFRTILLWLAFILLILQYFITIDSSIYLGILFRLAPSGLLLLWFALSVLIKDKLRINGNETPRFIIFLIKFLRPLASICIVIGALFKILHWPYGNILLIAGIGVMAIYSSVLSRYSYSKIEQNPDIIDDLED
jgi:hypothetical protein